MNILYRSSIYAVTAYFTVMLLEKAFMVAGGALFGYSVDFTYERLRIKADREDWSQESVLLIYLLPYLLQVIAYIWLYIKSERSHIKPSYKMMFIQWIMFFIAFRLLGMIPAHLYSLTGVYHALRWLYIGSLISLIIGTAGFFLFFLTGVKNLSNIYYFFGTFNNHFKITGSKSLLLASVLLPSAACMIFATLFYTPGFPKEEMLGLFLFALVVAFTYFRSLIVKPRIFSSRYKAEPVYTVKHLLLILIPALILIRVLLGFGISFN
jgi:hypothetical protein